MFQPYDEAVRILGKPMAEGAPALCPESHVAYYERPGAKMKLVFDPQGRVRAIGLLVTRKPVRGTTTLQWPGIDTSFATLRPYASHAGMASWSYNQGAQQLQYWETQAPTRARPGVRLFLGTLVIDRATEATSGGDLPTEDTSWMGNLRYGANFTNKDLEGLPAWRRTTVPNAFMLASSEPLKRHDLCSGQDLADFDNSNPSLNLTTSPAFIAGTGRRSR